MACVGRAAFSIICLMITQGKTAFRRLQMHLRRFLCEEEGQDLIEYTLLLAFVCLASAALFISAGGSVSGIWTAANSDLAKANTSAS
jgi:Flp pilus assembly pilin Flp